MRLRMTQRSAQHAVGIFQPQGMAADGEQPRRASPPHAEPGLRWGDRAVLAGNAARSASVRRLAPDQDIETALAVVQSHL